jgi:catechol 2,3-dioxygenase-like lactoylglutathione lyase family enzyme
MATMSPEQDDRRIDPEPIATLWINGTELRVADVARSVAFYRGIFGLPVREENERGVVLGIGPGPQYLRIVPAGGRPIGIANFSLAVQPSEPESLARRLAQFDVSSVHVAASGPGGASQVGFKDSNGFTVLLEAAAPAVGLAPAQREAPIPLERYSHVTFLGERAFYQRVFGLPIQVMQGPAYMLSVGSGPEFLTGIDRVPRELGDTPMPGHVCFAMQGYDPNRLVGLFMDAGLKPVEYFDHLTPHDAMTVRTRLRQVDWNGGGRTHPLGSYETYVRDPDNIEIQIQDLSYAGGSGANGQIIP